jgi:hypothetical protein
MPGAPAVGFAIEPLGKIVSGIILSDQSARKTREK